MIQVRAFKTDFSFGIQLRIHEERDGKIFVGIMKYDTNGQLLGIEMQECGKGTYLGYDHYMPLGTEDLAQQLMNDLWRCGMRPTEGKGSAGQLTAVQYHLEDMRRLVFESPEDRTRIVVAGEK